MFTELTKNIIINENQGYAFYFYNNGKIIEKTNGVVKEENSKEITFDSNFRLASVSKQFIAFAIVKLIKENKLSYDQNVKTIFNELPSYFEKITIKHLLNHTSGILNYEDMPHTDAQIHDEDIITFLKTTDKTYFEPGFTYKYSNTGYILLGLIVQKVSNRDLVDYIENEVFIPAKMYESKVNIEGSTNIKNRAYGHILNDDKLIVKDQYWCSATIGDGGLYSSVNELKKWIKYLLTTKEYQDMKIPNYINEESYNEYGLGIRITKINDKEIIYHCGDTIRTNTLLLFSVDYNMCLIFLTNLNNINTTTMKENPLTLIKENKL